MYETTEPHAAPRTILRDAVVVDAEPEPHDVLQRYFSFGEFRPLQEQIIGDVLDGRDVVALMPTGGGKSLCYQLPALIRPGLTVVVSPLIALMKDQVDFLRSKGIAASVLNSTLPPDRAQEVISGLEKGAYRLLYVAPERLMQPGFVERLARWNVALFAIDEAHCISDWGHDFRPEYRQLRELRLRFPDVPMMALTATATERVRQDIVVQLGLREPGVYVASFNRANLTYRVEPKRAAYQQLLDFLKLHADESGIVYCHTRKGTESLAAKLRDDGYAAQPYHAGLEQRVRAKHQDAFLQDRVRIICATIAFGMGVDKPNIRFVVHYGIPKNLESYYQETGRAGRDGDPSECLMFFGKSDAITHERRLDEKPAKERAIAEAQLDAIVQFAESETCRRSALLAYFDEEWPEENCESCDNCLGVNGRRARGWGPDLRKDGVNGRGRRGQETGRSVAEGPSPLNADPNAPKEDRTADARRFLGCLQEIQNQSRFSVGVMHVTDVLCGSQSEKVKRWGHDGLKWYGKGNHLSKAEWAHIGKALVESGYLAQSAERLPVLEITSSGRQLMLGEAGPVMIPVRAGSTPPPTECDAVLFERLRRLRKSIADAQEVPAYVVFSDVALRQMAREYPASPEAFVKVSGVGRSKLEAYGERFMREIAEHLASNERQTFEGEAPPMARKPMGDSEYDTLRRFRSGQPVDQIAREREIKETTVMGHLSRAADDGEEIELSRIVPEDAEPEIAAAFERVGWGNLTGVRELLGERYDYDVLRIYRAVRRPSPAASGR